MESNKSKIKVFRVDFEFIHDLKTYENLDPFLKILKDLIQKGNVIAIYKSYIMPKEDPVKCFSEIKDFDSWAEQIKKTYDNRKIN